MQHSDPESRKKLVELLEAKLGVDRARKFMQTPNPVLGWQKPSEIREADHLSLMRVTVLVTSMGTENVAA